MLFKALTILIAATVIARMLVELVSPAIPLLIFAAIMLLAMDQFWRRL